MSDDQYDVTIIGAGIVGIAISHILSAYRLRIACIERDGEIATGASGNNSGVIHSGINLKPGTKKAGFSVRGNAMMYDLCRRFNIPYLNRGTLVVALDDNDMKILDELKRRAELNGVAGVRLADKDEAKRIEPHVSASAGLFAPSGGITDPRRVCSVLAAAAKTNKVEFLFNSKVMGIDEKDGGYELRTGGSRRILSRVVVNSAGLYSDEVANMIGLAKYRIHPWLGEYYTVDRSKGHLLNSMIYPAPQFGGGGLGIHLTKSLDGRIFVGPNATYLRDKEERVRTPVEEFHRAVARFLPPLDVRDMSYGHVGVRAKLTGPDAKTEMDFVIEEYPRNFLNLLGIESPGFTAAPAIAEYAVREIGRMIDLRPRRRRS